MINFPEIWLKRVITNLTLAITALWLNDIPELDVPVAELGQGSDSESNTIHVPVSTFEPDVLINNTAYPLAVQAYTDSETTINLDKYQTKPTSISDDQAIGASYDRIDAATRSHTTAILKKKYAKAIHSLAPDQDSDDTPVLITTGDADSSGRKRLIYDDIVALGKKFTDMECPMEGRRLVLCGEHVADILLDRKNFGNLLVNYQAGQPAPQIAGFELFQYVANPYYDNTGKKLAFSSAPGATDMKASVAFYVPNVAKRTGMTKQYFSRAVDHPDTQSNQINYRHYFITLPFRKKYIGAIVSGS